MTNEIASEGQVFVCAACGKRSRDRYGNEKIDHGWDVSCMLHAVLCYDPPEVNTQGQPQWQAVTPGEVP